MIGLIFLMMKLMVAFSVAGIILTLAGSVLYIVVMTPIAIIREFWIGK